MLVGLTGNIFSGKSTVATVLKDKGAVIIDADKVARSVFNKKRAVIKGTDGRQIQLKNHNKFLWDDSNDLIGKTGYTRQAKHCFLGMVTNSGRKLIVVIQGSRKLWADLDYLVNRKYN